MKPVSREPQRFTLIVTGGTAGTLKPQGCACRRLGGIERRAGFIAQTSAASSPLLVLDSGGLLFAPGTVPSQEDLRNAGFLLSSLRHMQTAALNVSASDCAAGAEFLKKSAGQVPLLSANLRDSATQELLFSPYLITTVNRSRIGIFGLAGPSAASGTTGIYADDPIASAGPVVKALQRARCDAIVLLSQLSEAHNLRLLSDVPGIHFVFGSSDAPARAAALRSGDSYAFTPGQGTHAAVVECLLEGRGPAFVCAGENTTERRPDMPAQPARGSFTFHLAPLDSSVPADPAVELLLETFREEGARRQLNSRGLHYRDAVPVVDMSGLTETGRRRALRLMNAIACKNRPIAACAAGSQQCRDIGGLVVEGVRAGRTDGAIQFMVQRELQALARRGDVPLDKSVPVH
ncbi:MAG: hypothetical protein FJ119_12485 [Deltaproteobacteria bacterium]|nr:hypothetical protein [Deltaproteobacteria bacterium]